MCSGKGLTQVAADHLERPLLASGFIDANAKDSFPFGNESFASLFKIGGDKRDRTADLLNAIQALSPYKRVTNPLKGVGRALLVRRES